MDSGNSDLGVVSFMTVALSSTYLLGLGRIPSATITKVIIVATHILVSLNYCVGVYVGFAVLERVGFGIYCVVFAFLWAACAAFVGGLMFEKATVTRYIGEGSSLVST
uniref:Uncharacterized protein n=1 Tax=Grammatophora oceanica TaxID=210454 RepID=A0A7S1VTB8_9STRA|mmetsp:Transcript_5521/g.7683  ORF Transcript_5521/g.7683 Transcript_5521/m.7683 type:complete len:108 (+) Transcript_5521:385-708(+)